MTESDFADDPQFVSLDLMLRVMCFTASGNGARAGDALDAFIAHIERQPKEFRVGWDFSWLRGIIERSDAKSIDTHRAFLLSILEAVSKDSRNSILSELRRLRKQERN